jgi:hypothetical protein
VTDQARFTFDPASGYRFSPGPMRWAVFEPNGSPQSLGTVRGNNLGFRDSHDFHPKRVSSRPRVAVLGDSMSAGVYMPVAWPQRCQQIAAQRGRAIDVMNFSVDGGGIMNWWGIITKILGPENYELDACVLAVCCDDLSRGLFIRHDDVKGSVHHPWFGRVKGVRVDELPSTLDQARRHAFVLPDSEGLTREEMDESLARGRPLNSEFTRSNLIQALLFAAIIGHFRPQGIDAKGESFTTDMVDRIREIGQVLSSRGIPILVVQIPSPHQQGPAVSLPRGVSILTQRFAEMLNADAVDGSRAFESVPVDQTREYFLKGDAHWNQRGADLFASFFESELASWFAKRTTRKDHSAESPPGQ